MEMWTVSVNKEGKLSVDSFPPRKGGYLIGIREYKKAIRNNDPISELLRPGDTVYLSHGRKFTLGPSLELTPYVQPVTGLMSSHAIKHYQTGGSTWQPLFKDDDD